VARWKIEQCATAAWWKIGGAASWWWKLEVLWLWCRGVAAAEGPAELCERCGCRGRSCERAAVVEERLELRRGAQIGDCESGGK